MFRKSVRATAKSLRNNQQQDQTTSGRKWSLLRALDPRVGLPAVSRHITQMAAKIVAKVLGARKPAPRHRVVTSDQLWSTPIGMFESLEQRRLMDGTLTNAGDFLIYDSSNADPNDVDQITLTAVAGGATVVIAQTDGGGVGAADTIALTITDPNPGSADVLSVTLTSTGPIGNIVFNGSDGDVLNLSVTLAPVAIAGVGGASDQTDAAETDNGFANGDALTSNGGVGNTTLNGILAGGVVTINTSDTDGDIGTITWAQLDLSVATGTALVASAIADAGDFGGWRVTGATTLGNNNASFTTDADGGAGTNAYGAINLNGSGDWTQTTADGTAGGNTTTGLLTLSSSGEFLITSDAGDNLGTTALGGVTFATTAGNTADVTIVQGGTANMGAVSTGVITDNSGNSTDIEIGNATSTIASVTIGARTSTGARGDVVVTADAITGQLNIGAQTFSGAGDQTGDVEVTVTNSVGGVTVGDIVSGDAGDGGNGSNIVIDIGENGGTLTLNNITLNAVGGLTATADNWTAVNVNSVHNILGSGDISITADKGGTAALGTIGAVGAAGTWEVNFGATTTGSLSITAADGIGAVTFHSIDYLDATVTPNLAGNVAITADSDADTFGPIGAVSVLNVGDDATNTRTLDSSSSITAEDGTTINIAGDVDATLSATGGDDNNDGWTTVTVGGRFGGSLLADDGITSFTAGQVAGVTGGSASINANVDGGAEDSTVAAIPPTTTTGNDGANFSPVGSLGPVVVTGVAGADSFVAVVTAADFDTFVLNAGNWSANLTTNIATDADRNANTSNVTSIAVNNGNVNTGVNANDFTIDDGFVAGITVQALANVLADADFGSLILDADGALNAMSVRNGGLPGGISVEGHLVIGTLDTDAANQAEGATTNVAANDVGPILAGQDIAITGALDIGGSLPSVTIVNASGTANDVTDTLSGADATPDITIALLQVNGNVDRIATSGIAGANIFIGGAGSFIGGDLDEVDAGLGTVTIVGLHVLQGTTASPVFVVTSEGHNYFLDIIGADSGTAVVDYDLVINNATDSINIFDIDGLVSTSSPGNFVDDTIIRVATRLDGNTNSSSADNSTREFDLLGLQDPDSTAATRIDLRDLVIEGDLTGDVGADSNAFDGLADNNGGPLGVIENIQIQGTWSNAEEASGVFAGSHIFVEDIADLAFGTLLNDADLNGGNGTQFSRDSADGQFPTGSDGGFVVPGDPNGNGTQEALEIFGSLTASDETDVILFIPNGGSLTKSFVGPTGAIEQIRFTDKSNAADAVFATVVIDFVNGVIGDIHVFGDAVAIEYQAFDPANPATDGNTNIFYGVDQAGIDATSTSAPGVKALAFIEFSSSIGNVTTTDIDLTDDNTAGVGDILVGYQTLLDSFPVGDDNGDMVLSKDELRSFINDSNDGTGSSGSRVQVDGGDPAVSGDGTVIYGSLGNVSVDGALGGVVTSGGVGTITTVDTRVTDLADDAVEDADFLGLVTDGSAGAITVDGNVMTSLVVGDRVVTEAGDNDAVGGGDDTVDVNGTPSFGGAITVGGMLGMTEGDAGKGATPAIDGDEVSAPDGIGVAITVGEILNAAVVSGKRILVDPDQAQGDDDITGSITASAIRGDIWSGDDISAPITANGQGLIDFDDFGLSGFGHGDIAGVSGTNNNEWDIIATGASNALTGAEVSGNITGDITAAGNLQNVCIQAGIGEGGSVLANIKAGSDGSGEIRIDGGEGVGNFLLADDDLGLDPSGNYVTSADSQFWNTVEAGRQTDVVDEVDGAAVANPNILDGGDISHDLLAGTDLATSLPVMNNVAENNLPKYENENDSITIQLMQAGFASDSDADSNTNSIDDEDSDLNGTLVAAGSVIINTLNLDGNAIGNDAVAGGHIIAAGMGFKDATFGDPNVAQIGSGQIICNLLGTVSAGMFVPYDNTGNNPLNPADLGPLQAGQVLTLGTVNIGNQGGLEVGAWLQSATGTNDPASAPGGNGIELIELNNGTESGANNMFAPTFSIGATLNASINVSVIGKPGDGNTSPDPATGDIVDLSIGAFGNVTGSINATDSVDVNFVLANMDAVTAIDTSNGSPGDPSSPSTSLALNSGEAGNNTLSITSQGFGTGGLRVDFFLAGYDYFVDLDSPATANLPANAPAGSVETNPRVPNRDGVAGDRFYAAWGLGNTGGTLFAADADPTNGLEAGDLVFALVGAGSDNNTNLIAQDDIIAFNGGIEKDGALLIPGGKDGDVLAGLAVNNSISPLAWADLFLGGDVTGDIIAGDDIYKGEFIGGTPDVPGQTFNSTATINFTNLGFQADGTVDNDVTLNLPQAFDAALLAAFAVDPAAALTGVALSLSATILAGTQEGATVPPFGVGTIFFQNPTGVAATGAINGVTGTVTAAAPNVNVAATVTPNVTQVGGGTGIALPLVNINIPVAAGGVPGQVDFLLDSETDSGSVTLLSAQFAPYNGAGTFSTDVNVANVIDAGVTGGGAAQAFIRNPAYNGTVTVNYTYQLAGTPGTTGQLCQDADGFVVIAAQGHERHDGTGNVTGDIVSGAEDQLNGPDLFNTVLDDDNCDNIPDDESGNIWAFIIAGDDVESLIDAGDTHQEFGSVTGGGLGGESGLAGGSFRGGIHAGAGPDLDIFTTNDNSVGGDFNGILRAIDDVNVEDMGTMVFGILAEDDVNTIQVGWGINGGDLLGNVVAENDIEEIQVWGNVGRTGVDSVIYAGDDIVNFGVGDASDIVRSGNFNELLRDSRLYIDSVGTVFADVLSGNEEGSAGEGPNTGNRSFFVGDRFAADATLIAGLFQGYQSVAIQQDGRTANFQFDGGEGSGVGVIVVQGGDVSSVDAYAYNSDGGDNTGNGDAAIDVLVTGQGANVGFDRLVAVDYLNSLHVVGGSVGQIVVDDDYNVTADLDAALATFDVSLGTFPFLTNSLETVRAIEKAVNNDKQLIDAGVINVSGNIGVQGTSIGAGLNVAMSNYAIFVEGDLTTDVFSETGSIGNVVTGQTIDSAFFDAYVNIGDIFAGEGGFGPEFGDGYVAARTGSIGVISVRDGIDVDDSLLNGDFTNEFDAIIFAAENLGGLISRGGSIGAYDEFDPDVPFDQQIINDFSSTPDAGVHVHGSIGLLQASGHIAGQFIAETGSIGIDLDPNDKFGLRDGAGIHSAVGNIDGRFIAGTDIGNITAKTGSVNSQVQDVLITANNLTVTLTEDNFGSFVSDLFELLGDIGGSGRASIEVNRVWGLVRAGGNVGNISAFKDIGNYVVEAGGTVGNLSTEVGSIGSGQLVTIFALPQLDAHPDIVLGITKLGRLEITGRDGVGNIDSARDIGGSNLEVNFQGIDVEIEGSAVEINSIDGPVGDIIAHIGDIGHINNPLVVNANGGVDIDPVTLQYVNSVNGTVLEGIGNVFAETGSIVADLTTGGSIGALNTGTGRAVLGGIAAPIGSAILDLHVGGHIGGLSAGGGVAVSPDSVILGSIGLIRNASSGTFTASGITSSNPLIVITDGTEYRVEVESGSASATYTINPDGSVNFDQIDYTPANATSSLKVLTASGASDTSGNNSSVQTNVDVLNIFGSLGDTLTVDGSVGTLNVTGNIAATASYDVEGGIGSIVTGGTNALKSTVTLNKNNKTVTVGNKSVSIDNGEAQVTINGGFIEEVRIVKNVSKLNVVGDVRSIVGASTKVSAKTVTITGDVESILVAKGVSSLTINGNAGIIDGGTSLKDVNVFGNVDVLKATRSISNVQVTGNAGVVAAGSTLSNVFIGGSSIKVGARSVSNVQITGSLGIEVGGGSGGLSLGVAFSAADAARILGVSGLAGLQAIADTGPQDGLFLGGLEARSVKDTVVGGLISDLVVFSTTISNSDSLILSTVDDVIFKGDIVKINGIPVG